MSLLQSQSANSVEFPVRKSHFSTRIAPTPLPPLTPWGYNKGNVYQYNINAMNNIMKDTSYFPVNGTAHFYSFSGPKNCHSASISAIFAPKTAHLAMAGKREA